MTSGFCVGDIVAHPSLDTRAVAGEAGLTRTVLWAHSCEKPDPARWLGPHELLMTIGLCIPRSARAQRQLIASLDEAGLAGMTVADDELAPALTDAMLAEANARSFPILITGENTPFAAIGRTVAAANADRQTMQVLLLAKLYQIAGQREGSRQATAALEDVFGTELTVVDTATDCVVMGSRVIGPAGGRTYKLRTHRPAHLVLDAAAELDAFSLVHLTQVLSVDANVVLQEAVQTAVERASLLDSALRGRAEALKELDRAWGEDASAYRVIVTTCGVPFRVPLALAIAGTIALASEADGEVVLVLPQSQLDDFRQLAGELDLVCAASSVQRDTKDLPGGLAEARAEFPLLHGTDVRWREFHGQRVSLLARSPSESKEIVRTVLGPLAKLDPQMTMLRETLFSFLDHDMKWKTTAQALGLHRQTVDYRLRQVEVLTGRSVRRAKDLAEFWLARTAWENTPQLKPESGTFVS